MDNNNIDEEPNAEPDEITFDYFCKFCNSTISIDEILSCEHAIYHFATVGIIIVFDDCLRKLIFQIISDKKGRDGFDDDYINELLESIGITLDKSKNPIFNNFDDIEKTIPFYSPWSSFETIEMFMDDITEFLPSFYIEFSGYAAGIEGIIGNYFGLACNEDIARLKAKYC